MTKDEYYETLDGKKHYTRIFRDIAGHEVKDDRGYIDYIEIICDTHPEVDNWSCLITVPNLDETLLLDETQLYPLSDTLKEIKILIDEGRK